jgi:hypothetical protein
MPVECVRIIKRVLWMIMIETIECECCDNHVEVYVDKELIGILRSGWHWYTLGNVVGYFETFEEGLSAFVGYYETIVGKVEYEIR